MLLMVTAFPSYASSQSGGVSYYWQGQHTASGERFNKHANTCAHRKLPFGTWVTVSHRGLSVKCRVNDRGPFIKSRVLDVSLGVARQLNMTGAGVIHATIFW